MDKLAPRSESFLLRCWQERSPQTGLPGIWRYSLEDTRTGRRVGFITLEAALAYVRDKLITSNEQ